MAIPFSKTPRYAIGACCTLLHTGFGTVYAWSFFQTMLSREYGWSSTETVTAFAVAMFFWGLSAGVGGLVLPRMGPRALALVGSGCFAVGYLVAALALEMGDIDLFYLGYGVLGGIGIGAGYVTPVVTVAKWFPRRRGLATGTVVMGFGIGALVLSKIVGPFFVAITGGELPLVFLLLGVFFAVVLVPCSLVLRNPDAPEPDPESSGAKVKPARQPLLPYIMSGSFVVLWVVFFTHVAAGISVIGFQSELLQEIWGLADPALDSIVLAEYGATLIAVSSVCNGLGRLFWAWLSDRIGRVAVYRVLLGSQLIVFGLLMSQTNPWIFGALVCYVLLCYGGGWATMPSLIIEVFGSVNMPKIYGGVLTGAAAAGVVGPLIVGYFKDIYPDRAVMYCLLLGILMLGAGYVVSFLLSDERMRLGRPTIARTLARQGIAAPAAGGPHG